MTPRQLLSQHPEWADLPMAVYRSDGGLDYVGAAGSVYESRDYGDAPDIEAPGVKFDRVLVFSPN